MQRRLSECRNDARHGEDAPVNALRPLDEADDRGELAYLNLAEQRRPVAHARVARDRADAWAGDEMAHHPARRVLVEQRVAVEADQEFVPGRQRRHAQTHGLALIHRKVNNAQARFSFGQPLQPLASIVGRRVVKNDYLEILEGLR